MTQINNNCTVINEAAKKTRKPGQASKYEGVGKNQSTGPYWVVKTHNPITGKTDYLGHFDYEDEAIAAIAYNDYVLAMGFTKKKLNIIYGPNRGRVGRQGR